MDRLDSYELTNYYETMIETSYKVLTNLMETVLQNDKVIGASSYKYSDIMTWGASYKFWETPTTKGRNPTKLRLPAKRAIKNGEHPTILRSFLWQRGKIYKVASSPCLSVSSFTLQLSISSYIRTSGKHSTLFIKLCKSFIQMFLLLTNNHQTS